MKQEKMIYAKPEMDICVFMEEVVVTSGDIYDADKIEGEEGGIIDVGF